MVMFTGIQQNSRAWELLRTFNEFWRFLWIFNQFKDFYGISKSPQLLMVMSSDADSSTDGKPWISAFRFDILYFVEVWLNLVAFSNRDLRFPKWHENHKIHDFTSKNEPKIKDFAIFMEVWKSGVSIRNRCLGTFLRSKFSEK